MPREWKPGDVAVINDTTREDNWQVAICTKGGKVGDARWNYGKGDVWSSVSVARPLVVIDPEDREQVERLVVAYSSQPDWHTGYMRCRIDAMQAALRELANPTPPKPQEPTGLGAVVKDGYGKPWVRFNSRTGYWWRNDSGVTLRYDDLSVSKVLSEGVTP